MEAKFALKNGTERDVLPDVVSPLTLFTFCPRHIPAHVEDSGRMAGSASLAPVSDVLEAQSPKRCTSSPAAPAATNSNHRILP